MSNVNPGHMSVAKTVPEFGTVLNLKKNSKPRNIHNYVLTFGRVDINTNSVNFHNHFFIIMKM